MDAALAGYPVFLNVVKQVVFWLAVLVGIVAIVDWAVRTRRIQPFSAIARFFRRYVDPLLAPIERRVVRRGGLPASAPWWALGVVVVGGLLLIALLDFLDDFFARVAFGVSSPGRFAMMLVVVPDLAVVEVDPLVVSPDRMDAAASATNRSSLRTGGYHAPDRVHPARDPPGVGIAHRVSGAGLRIMPTATGVRVSVRVQPRASANALAGVHGDALRVRLTAPPVDGAANDALIEFLADTFGIARRAITIIAGSSSRSKIVELAGITEDRVRRLVGH